MKVQYCYIYKLTNKITGRIYVGQHFYSDMNDNYFCSGSEIRNELRNGIYSKDDFDKVILQNKMMTQTEADDLEIHYIKKFDSFVYDNPNGYNKTRGGQKWNMLGSKRTDDQKQNISNSLMGRKCTDLHRANISKSLIGNQYNTGKTLSDEHKKKISESNKGIKRPKTQEQIEKHRKAVTGVKRCKDFFKPILQYDLENNIIAEFETIELASISNNLKAQYILRCARGVRKTYSKFIWKFK